MRFLNVVFSVNFDMIINVIGHRTQSSEDWSLLAKNVYETDKSARPCVGFFIVLILPSFPLFLKLQSFTLLIRFYRSYQHHTNWLFLPSDLT